MENIYYHKNTFIILFITFCFKYRIYYIYSIPLLNKSININNNQIISNRSNVFINLDLNSYEPGLILIISKLY